MWTRFTIRLTWKISTSGIAPGSAAGPACTWPAQSSNIAIAPPPRATTPKSSSRRILEINYLRFVARAVSDAKVFRRLWQQAIRRLYLLKSPLSFAAGIALRGGPRAPAVYSEALFLALTDGSVSVFPGRPATGKPRVLVASPYLPFPLSHGGAVRMYNLMRRAAEEFDLVLVAFTEHAAPPPPEILADLRRSGAGAARRQPRPSAHRPSGGGRGIRFRRPSAPPCSRLYASGIRPSPNWNSRNSRSTPPIALPPAPSWWNTTSPSISTSSSCGSMTAGNFAAKWISGANSKPAPGKPWTASSP